MPVTSDFVRELFAAANQIEVLSTSERTVSTGEQISLD
jgi:hypothetical protein